jgi:hypothetical protein
MEERCSSGDGGPKHELWFPFNDSHATMKRAYTWPDLSWFTIEDKDRRQRNRSLPSRKTYQVLSTGGYSLNRVCWISAQTSICLVHRVEVSTI